MGLTDSTIKVVLGAGLLVLAAGFVVVAVSPDAAAWLAAWSLCNGRPCSPAGLRRIAPIVAAMLGGFGLLIGGFGLRGLLVPARRSLGPALQLAEMIRAAAGVAQAWSVERGSTQVVDARHDPALREAVLRALREHGLHIDSDRLTRPPAAGRSGDAGRTDRLGQLARLRDAGILTPEEYEILRRNPPAGP